MYAYKNWMIKCGDEWMLKFNSTDRKYPTGKMWWNRYPVAWNSSDTSDRGRWMNVIILNVLAVVPNGSNGRRYRLRIWISMTICWRLRFLRSLSRPFEILPTANVWSSAYLMAARVLRSTTAACCSSLFSRSISRSFDPWLCSVSNSLTIRFCSRSSVDSLALYSSREPSFTWHSSQKKTKKTKKTIHQLQLQKGWRITIQKIINTHQINCFKFWAIWQQRK